jgi:hypothetical protein
MTWRFNIHELDEFQGKTLMFRWESYGSSSSCRLYIDDIKIEVWNNNEIHADNITGSQYTVTALNNGDYYFRVWAVDNDFGPGWASEAVSAHVSAVGIADYSQKPVPGVSSLGLVTPNPVYSSAVIPVTVAPQDMATAQLTVFDVYGRQVADLTSLVTDTGYRNIVWNMENSPAGVHFVRLETASGVSVRRIVSAVR